MLIGDLITLALKDSGAFGIGQTPLTEDIADCLTRLNMMIGQWNRRRWLIYHLIDSFCVCDGSLNYSVGPAQAINIPRPDRLEAAYIRQIIPTNSTPVDWPLDLIESREDYSRIAIKKLAASPAEHLFYDSGYPTGLIYPWPLPNYQYELHILTKAVLPSFAAVGDDVILPPEYQEAIYTNLMVRLRMAYRLPADPVIVGLAKASLATIRKANFQIGRLRLPSPITRGPAYNIFSDRGN